MRIIFIVLLSITVCKLVKALQSGVKEKIEKLLQEGRRAMIGEDFQGSLQPLSECCHLITTNFGEMDPQLAGSALCPIRFIVIIHMINYSE